MTLDGLLVGTLLILAGIAAGWTAWLGSQRRLARNRVVGIRTRSTLRDDAAWAAAHEAAAGPLGIAGGIAVTGGIGVLAVGLDSIGAGLAIATAVGTLVAALVSGRIGVTAARATSDRQPD